MKNRSLLPLLLLSLLLAGADNGEQGIDEKAKLLEQQQQLSGKIETLKQEQAYLLFQKEMYASDSKYLVINIASRTGQLKYKNRILKDFQVANISGSISAPAPGASVLTKKIGGPQMRNLLIFGNSFVLQGKQSTRSSIERKFIPRIALSKKDFLSIFYAVEVGARAYLLP